MRLKINSTPSPQGPVIGYEADLSASPGCRGARSRHGEENWSNKRGSGAASFLSKEQAWPRCLQRVLNILATRADVVLRLINCRHQSVAKTSARHLRVKDLDHPREDLRCQIGSFFSVVVPPSPFVSSCRIRKQAVRTVAMSP